MISNETIPNNKGVKSIFNKFFLCLLGAVLISVLSGIIYVLAIFISYLFADAYRLNEIVNGSLFFIGAIIIFVAFLLMIIRKEAFYTHIIINEDGIIYFDKYRLRQCKVIEWSQIVDSPVKNSKNDKDVYLGHYLIGKESVMFWYKNRSKLVFAKERFGGFGPFPFLYANQRELLRAFVLGVSTYRKDLRIDPKLIRYVIA